MWPLYFVHYQISGNCWSHIYPRIQITSDSGVALRPRRPGSVYTPELAICFKCGAKRKCQGWNFHLLVISSIISTVKTQFPGVLHVVHPQACKNLNIGDENSMKFQFWGYFTLLLGLTLPLLRLSISINVLHAVVRTTCVRNRVTHTHYQWKRWNTLFCVRINSEV